MSARNVATVTLPRIGWKLYQPGQQSDCPNHKYCAYDGSETGRCPDCHTAIRVGCEHNWGGLPSGSRPCRCRGCEEVFSSTAAFDKHQTVTRGCLPPDERGLVLTERSNGWTVWALPGDRPPIEN